MRFLISLLTVLLVLTASPLSADTTITYQGQLQDASGPYTGTPGMVFQLYDSLVDGNQVGESVFFSGVPVEDGLFQVDLDFGEGAFDGGERWLQIEVAGDTLSPRQKITGSPWSHQALSVAAGSVGSDQIAPGAVGSDELQSDSVSIGSGTGLQGGGEIPLGGSTTIGIAPGGVGTEKLANEAITGNKLDSNIDISTSGTITANDLNAEGELRVNANADSDLSYIRFRDSSASLGPRIFHRDTDNQIMFRGVSNVDVGGSFSAETVDAQTYLQDGQPFEPGAQTIVQTLAPEPGEPGTVWMRLDEPGTQIWQHSLHSSGVRSVFERDGAVYSGSRDNTVMAADASGGGLLWQHSLHSAFVESVFERNGVVYSGSSDDTVIAADASDGSLEWQHSLHLGIVFSVFERSGVVYSGSSDDTVIAVDASDGSLEWQHSLHSDTVWSVFERNGVIYSGSSDNTVVAADASDGSLEWQHSLHSGTVASVFERNHVVYSGSWDNTVIAADASDGSLLWQHGLHSGTVYSVFERNGVVYSGSNDNTVIAADARTGAFLWRHSLHSGPVFSVFERNGVIYSGSNDTTVIAATVAPATYISDGNEWWHQGWISRAGGD